VQARARKHDDLAALIGGEAKGDGGWRSQACSSRCIDARVSQTTTSGAIKRVVSC